jgi:hypothetical protein
VWDGLHELFDEFSGSDRDRVLGETAVDFYGIDQARIAAALALRAE